MRTWDLLEHKTCAPIRLCHPGHRVTTLGAPPAFFRAALHHLVIAHRLARCGARTADVGACTASCLMLIRVAEHEIRTGRADLRAIEQKREVRGVGMRPALFQAQLRCRQARLVTGATRVNARLHRVGVSMSGRVWHRMTSGVMGRECRQRRRGCPRAVVAANVPVTRRVEHE